MFNRCTPIAVIAALAITHAADAATLNVPSPAYPTLPIAISAAASGDEIILAPGQYIAVPGFVISDKQLTLRGDTSDPGAVVLDGFGIAGNTVLSITGAGAAGTTLENLTVTGGFNSVSGAGIFASTSIILSNCHVRDNRVTGLEVDAAGIYVPSGNLTCTRCTFTRNVIDEAGDGGAVFVITGNVLIENCQFVDNGQDVGAIDGEARGGALRVDSGALSLRRTVFDNNRCGRGAALYVSQDAHLYIDACIFRNGSGVQAAGLYVSGTSASRIRVVRNTLFDGNATTSNDAAIFTNRPLTVTNCTVVNNRSDTNYILGGSPPAGSVIVDNCIFWGNTEGVALLPSPMAAVVRHTTLESPYAAAGSGSSNNSLADPMFVSNQDDFRLMPASPAIDSGDSNLYFGPFVDLAGSPRGVDSPTALDTGHSIDGPIIDRGCYEYQAQTTVPGCSGDVNGDDVVNFTDLTELLENWGVMCP